MQKDISYYRQLLERWLRNQVSGAEAREVSDFLREQPELAAELLSESGGEAYISYVKANAHTVDDAISDRLLERVLKTVAARDNQFSSTDQPPRIPFLKRPGFRYAAAAAILILFLGGAGWLYLANKNEKPNIADAIPKAAPADIAAPKSNRASITLASGKTIFLDSAADGELAVQGRTALKKIADGQIIYTAEKNAAGASETIGKETAYNTLTNPRGSKVISLTLSDGTKVWLNAESSLHYPTAFNGSSREVEITGEGYFEVKHDAAHPFHVKAGDQLIEDIGTGFNVDAYPDETTHKTTLIEGSVKVNGKLLKPGEQAILKDSRLTVKDADTDMVTAWKNGFFAFDQADINTVMRDLARWYDVTVEYEGTPDYNPFQGKIGKTLTLAQVLKGLEQVNVHFRISQDRKIIILPKGKS